LPNTTKLYSEKMPCTIWPEDDGISCFKKVFCLQNTPGVFVKQKSVVKNHLIFRSASFLFAGLAFVSPTGISARPVIPSYLQSMR